MLGIGLIKTTNKKIINVSMLNDYLNSHIKIDIEDDDEFKKASKMINIVNNMLSEYDTSLLHNKPAFEKAKAYMIKDLIKNKSSKLTKDLIKKNIDNRLTGSRAYALRRKRPNEKL